MNMIPVVVLGLIAAAVEGTGVVAAGDYIQKHYLAQDYSKEITAEQAKIDAEQVSKGFQVGGTIKPGDYNYGYAMVALANHVANLDGVAPDEKQTVRLLYGRYAADHPSKDAENFKVILASVAKDNLNFAELTTAYLSKLSLAELDKMDNVVKRVIAADNTYTEAEKAFMEKDWKPYLESRKAAH
jgi:transcription termination factor NusB